MIIYVDDLIMWYYNVLHSYSYMLRSAQVQTFPSKGTKVTCNCETLLNHMLWYLDISCSLLFLCHAASHEGQADRMLSLIGHALLGRYPGRGIS